MMYTKKLEDKVLNTLKKKGNITVINTQPYSRNGYVEIACPATFTGNVVKDEAGKTIMVQRLKNGHLAFMAKNVPANGEKQYELINKHKRIKETGNFPVAFSADETSGAITSIKVGDKEWVDGSKFDGMMEALYVGGLDPEKYDTPKLVKSGWVEDGPVIKKWRASYDLEGTNGLTYEVSQFNGLNELKVSVTIDKKPVRTKESLHFALPFNIDNATTRIGVGNGVISPEQNQLSGANKDYYSVQRWLNLSNGQNNITVSSPEGALYEIGKMIDEKRVINGYKKWLEEGSSSSTVFLYAMNNYWHTNYKADQGGKATFDVYFKFDNQPFDKAQANRFGYDCTEPLFVVGAL